MAVTFTQEDTAATFNVGCSAKSAGPTTAGREARDGGSAGSSEVTVDPGNLSADLACFIYDCNDPPNIASWQDGTWNITIDFSTGDAGTRLKEVYVCDYNGTGYTVVCSETGLTYDTSSGPTTRNIAQGGAHTPQSQSLSRPFIVLVLDNIDLHGASSVGITPGSTIVAPFTVTVTRTATVAVTVGGATMSASGTVSDPVYTATAAITVGGATMSASGTVSEPTATATAAITVGGATMAATAAFTAPVYTATAAITVGGATMSASASFTGAGGQPLGSPSLTIGVGIRV